MGLKTGSYIIEFSVGLVILTILDIYSQVSPNLFCLRYEGVLLVIMKTLD